MLATALPNPATSAPAFPMVVGKPALPPPQAWVRLSSGPGALRAIQAANPGATIASYESDEEVIGEGDAAESYFKVVDGLFRAVKFTRDGRRQIFAFYGPGDMFGLDIDRTHGSTIEAVAPGTLAIFSRARTGSGLQGDASLAMALFAGAAKALGRAVDHMTMIGRSSAVERLAWFLADISGRFGEARQGRVRCILVMGRRDVADYLGLTIETVSRTLAILKQHGIIVLQTSRDVEICKPDLLKRLASADKDDAVVNKLLA